MEIEQEIRPQLFLLMRLTMTLTIISCSSVTAFVVYPTRTSRFQVTCICITFGNGTECF